MSNLTGMERFAHLEDKVYRAVEYVRYMRDEKEKLEREAIALRTQVDLFRAEKENLEQRIATLLNQKDAIQLKVESMLDTIKILEPEIAEVLQD